MATMLIPIVIMAIIGSIFRWTVKCVKNAYNKHVTNKQ